MGPYEATPLNLALRAERKAEQAVQTWRLKRASKYYHKAAELIGIILEQDSQDPRLPRSLLSSLQEQQRFYLSQKSVCLSRRSKISHLLKDRSSLTFNLIKQAKQLAQAKDLLRNSMLESQSPSTTACARHSRLTHTDEQRPTNQQYTTFHSNSYNNPSASRSTAVPASSSDKITYTPQQKSSKMSAREHHHNHDDGSNDSSIDDMASRFSDQMTLSDINRLFGEHNRLLDQLKLHIEQSLSLSSSIVVSDVEKLTLGSKAVETQPQLNTNPSATSSSSAVAAAAATHQDQPAQTINSSNNDNKDNKSCLAHKDIISSLRRNQENLRGLVCNIVEELEKLKSENKRLKSQASHLNRAPYNMMTESQSDTCQLPPLEPPTLFY